MNEVRIFGLGTRVPEETTIETLMALEECAVVYSALQDPKTEAWLKTLAGQVREGIARERASQQPSSRLTSVVIGLAITLAAYLLFVLVLVLGRRWRAWLHVAVRPRLPAVTEGLQLFASFAILLNFPRFGKMKGMGQIVTWSVRDESLHCQSIIKLFHTFVRENPEIWTEELRHDIYVSCATIVSHEDSFIDLAFEQGAIEGLSAEEVKQYIRYIADRRLIELGLNQIFKVEKNPLPWLDEMLNAVEHANFFENRATEYSKASTVGTWEDAFSALTPILAGLEHTIPAE